MKTKTILSGRYGIANSKFSNKVLIKLGYEKEEVRLDFTTEEAKQFAKEVMTKAKEIEDKLIMEIFSDL